MKGLIIVYALTVIGTVGAFRNPLIGLFVYVGFAVLRPQAIFSFAGDMDGISRIVGIATLISWALHGFGNWKFGKGRGVVVALLMFAGWSVLSTLQATDQAVAWASDIELAKIVLPFLVGVTLLDKEDDIRKMAWIIALAQGYVSFELNLSYWRGWNQAAEGFGGMDNNCLGVSLVTVIGPAIALSLTNGDWRLRWLAGTSVALILHATLLTFSRGAMVGLLGVGLTAFFILPKRPMYVGAMLLVGVLAIRLTGPELAARYATAFLSAEEGGDQGEGRMDLWKDCLRVMASKPMFGIGPNNWRVVAASYGYTEGKSAHSVWMETAAELGAPGVLALLTFFGWAAVRLWPLARARLTPETRYQTATAAGIIMGIAGFAIAGQFVSLVGLEVPYYLAMVGVAMIKLKAQPAISAKTQHSMVTPPPGPRLAPAMAGGARWDRAAVRPR
jgi:O-antigen ligase